MAIGGLAYLGVCWNGVWSYLHEGRRTECSVKATTDEPQWVPTQRDIADARVTHFARFAEKRTGAAFPDYEALRQWSVDEIESFWAVL